MGGGELPADDHIGCGRADGMATLDQVAQLGMPGTAPAMSARVHRPIGACPLVGRSSRFLPLLEKCRLVAGSASAGEDLDQCRSNRSSSMTFTHTIFATGRFM